LKLSTDRHEASRGLSATAELLVGICGQQVRLQRLGATTCSKMCWKWLTLYCCPACPVNVQLPPTNYRWPVASTVTSHFATDCLALSRLEKFFDWLLQLTTEHRHQAEPYSRRLGVDQASMGVATLRQWRRLVNLGSSWNNESRPGTLLLIHRYRGFNCTVYCRSQL